MSTHKLYVYDSSSSIDRRQASGRFTQSPGLVTLPVPDLQALHAELGGCLGRGMTFRRALFQTHGNAGLISFGGQHLTASGLRGQFVPYAALFPQRAKIYFDGCNVAEGPRGWDFLLATGQSLLRIAGGIAMGYTSIGHGLPGWLPFFGGHTVHVFGDLRFIDFGPGGVELSRFDAGSASMWETAAAVKLLNRF